jgi:HSP90 family molecular chaperone
MDEHIVSTYLSRIGSSYEFAKERLKLDAISRFGIGFLSCFMVADQVTIKSCRLSRYGGDDQGITVTIPSIDRHFEITTFFDPSWEGTSVSLEILPEKMAALVGRQGMLFDFKITEYLKDLVDLSRRPYLLRKKVSDF